MLLEISRYTLFSCFMEVIEFSRKVYDRMNKLFKLVALYKIDAITWMNMFISLNE